MKMRMIGLAVSMLATTAAAQSSLPAPADNRLDPVHISNPLDPANAGNGARFQVAGRCATVTAAHVVKGTSEPDIFPLKSSNGPAQVRKVYPRFDAAVIWQSHSSTSNCGTLPNQSQILAAIESGNADREVRFIDAGGGERIVKVHLTGKDSFDLRLTSKDQSRSGGFRPGNSGGLVVFDGVPVGIITDAFTGNSGSATALRLDWVLNVMSDFLPQPSNAIDETPGAAVPKSRFKAFDIAQLPSDFQRVVSEARKVRKQAQTVAKEADRVKERAIEKAKPTYNLPEATVQNGVAWFEIYGDQKRTYRGEASVQGTTISNDGYGTVRNQSLDFLGNTHFCYFAPSIGCKGIGILEYGANANNTTERAWYKGSFNGSKQSGPAHIRWVDNRSGSGFVTIELWGDPNVQGPQVHRSTRSYWYEGQAKGRFNGMGVVWNDKGQVFQIGTWKNGQAVQNVTALWRAGRYRPGSLREVPIETAEE